VTLGIDNEQEDAVFFERDWDEYDQLIDQALRGGATEKEAHQWAREQTSSEEW
jgi:hypothetical protein